MLLSRAALYPLAPSFFLPLLVCGRHGPRKSTFRNGQIWHRPIPPSSLSNQSKYSNNINKIRQATKGPWHNFLRKSEARTFKRTIYVNFDIRNIALPVCKKHMHMVCCIMGGYTKRPEHNLARKMRKLNSAYRIALIAHRSVRVRID